MNKKYLLICNWCDQPTVIIWVHGHGQCSFCGINVDECCRGEEVQHSIIKEENGNKDENNKTHLFRS